MRILTVIWTTLALILAPTPVLTEAFSSHGQDSMEEVVSSSIVNESSKRATRIPRRTPPPGAICKGVNVGRERFRSNTPGTRSFSCLLHILNRALLI